MTRTFVALALTLCTATACGKKNSPAAPTPTVTAVTVAPVSAGTIYLGTTSQFQVRETLSDATTRTSTTGAWGSDAPAVATVSATGLVSALAAGEATIFVDGGARGALRIRVYPNFAGTWNGEERAVGCNDSGIFAGLCGELEFVGQVFTHLSTFTQTDAAVNASLTSGTTATTTGTVSIGGDLELLPAPYLPADPDIEVQARNWRSRADVPSRMTGTYEGVFSAPGFDGSMTFSFQLENVAKAGAAPGRVPSRPGGALDQLRRQMAERVRQRR